MDNFNTKGLTSSEVSARQASGQTNIQTGIKTRSIPQILWKNFFTLFNILNLIMGILVFSVKEFAQGLFLFLIFLNYLIGIVQEIKAKLTIDKLSLINQPKTKVIRDSITQEIGISEVVLDDLIILNSGSQVSSDCLILDGECEVNESMLTGESDAVVKSKDDTLMSGSYIISGEVKCKVIHVGIDNYASKITSSVKKFKKTRAEIPLTLRAIIRAMSILVIPLAIGTFCKAYFIKNAPLPESVLNMTASSLSMIPQGLVALSSVVFALSVVRLSKHKTLSQDLYCTELLARVDTLCLDKTGTITEGIMQVDEVYPYNNTSIDEVTEILTAITCESKDTNPTSVALSNFCKGKPCNLEVLENIPFSSERKWQGITLNDGTSYCLGASEFLLNKENQSLAYEKSAVYSQNAQRVLCLVKTKAKLTKDIDKNKTELISLIAISDKIRENAKETLDYFAEQGVNIKIISGDNAQTVSAVAKRAGLLDADNYIDASTLHTQEEVIEASKIYTVFGRVTPEQKLWLIKAYKSQKHTVAMTGDGVNDVMALREADCSIAFSQGSDAARNVSQLVLLDNNFASMPKVVSEGRQTINNLQRTASLYLVKTIYSLLIAIFFLFVGKYPFLPLHLTLIGVMTIGTPSLILAIEPNKELVKGRFLINILKKCLPVSLTIFLSVVALQISTYFISLTTQELATVALLVLAVPSFLLLYEVSRPFNLLRVIMFILMLLGFVVGWNFFSKYTELIPITLWNRNMFVACLPNIACSLPFMKLMQYIFNRLKPDYSKIDKILSIDKA